MRILTLLFLLISFTVTAQNFDVLPTVDTVLSTDKMLIRPLSTTSPALRRITLEQLKRFVNRGVTATDTTKWSLTGNSGTTAGTNFIGTTDSKALYFKTKNTTAIVVDTSQNVGIGTATPGYKLDVVGSFSSSVGTTPNFVTHTQSGFQASINNYDASEGGGLTIDTFGRVDITSTSIASIASDTLRLSINGTQGAGKVLTSDADGNASWQVLALTDTATLDFGTIAPNGHETLTITVTGAALGDVVSLGIPNSSVNDHGAYMAWVSATDTVSIKCFNFDGSGFDPAEGVFKVKVFK